MSVNKRLDAAKLFKHDKKIDQSKMKQSKSVTKLKGKS